MYRPQLVIKHHESIKLDDLIQLLGKLWRVIHVHPETHTYTVQKEG